MKKLSNFPSKRCTGWEFAWGANWKKLSHDHGPNLICKNLGLAYVFPLIDSPPKQINICKGSLPHDDMVIGTVTERAHKERPASRRGRPHYSYTKDAQRLWKISARSDFGTHRIKTLGGAHRPPPARAWFKMGTHCIELATSSFTVQSYTSVPVYRGLWVISSRGHSFP